MSVQYHEHAERGRYTDSGDADPDACADVNAGALPNARFDPVTSPCGDTSRGANRARDRR